MARSPFGGAGAPEGAGGWAAAPLPEDLRALTEPDPLLPLAPVAVVAVDGALPCLGGPEREPDEPPQPLKPSTSRPSSTALVRGLPMRSTVEARAYAGSAGIACEIERQRSSIGW